VSQRDTYFSDLSAARPPAELVRELHELCASGCADRMAARKQPATGVDGQFSGRTQLMIPNQTQCFTRTDEPEVFQGDRQGRRGGIVDLNEINLSGLDRPGLERANCCDSCRCGASIWIIRDKGGGSHTHTGASGLAGCTVTHDDYGSRSVSDRRAHGQV
jgi:hypothetical protein